MQQENHDCVSKKDLLDFASAIEEITLLLNIRFSAVNFVEEFCQRFEIDGHSDGHQSHESLTEDVFIERAPTQSGFLRTLGLLRDVPTEEPAKKFRAMPITFGHDLWTLVQHLLIHIRFSVTEAQTLDTFINLDHSDFSNQVVIAVKNSTPNSRFIDYSRQVFCRIRHHFSINREKFGVCRTLLQLRKVSSVSFPLHCQKVFLWARKTDRWLVDGHFFSSLRSFVLCSQWKLLSSIE